MEPYLQGDATCVSCQLRERNRVAYERVVRLTREGIGFLEKEGKVVTLVNLRDATRPLEPGSKGLDPKTILRNPDARKLYQDHSKSYQEHHLRGRRAKRNSKRVMPNSKEGNPYRGLQRRELIDLIEKLKHDIAESKKQLNEAQLAKAEACRIRDEALLQNARQLAALTNMSNQRQGMRDDGGHSA